MHVFYFCYQLAGVRMQSNMFQPAAPVHPTVPPPGSEHNNVYLFHLSANNSLVITGRERDRDSRPDITDNDLTEPPSPTETDSPRTRTFFPETWQFLVNQTEYV